MKRRVAEQKMQRGSPIERDRRQTDVSTDGICFSSFKGTSRCVVSEMRKRCLLLHLLLLWCRFSFLGLIFFSSPLFLCLRGGTFYPILLALSVAMLSAGDQRSSPSKFGLHFYPFVYFCFCAGISRLFTSPVDPLKCAFAHFLSAAGYCDHLLSVLFEQGLIIE